MANKKEGEWSVFEHCNPLELTSSLAESMKIHQAEASTTKKGKVYI